LSCVFYFFDAGGSVFGCVFVYTHTNTQTARGVLDVSPGVDTGHLEGLRNPDQPNLGIFVFVYVYKVYMCVYMLGSRMRSGLTVFFLNVFLS